ncbi:ABC transporter permease [Streptomyces sp. N2-109]|uniref:ABC transporter permease n=1 Tax=Streptomyces gossypii TaxID=2883101 RepID=A0ABT2JYF0_9ACTN|nr:ABC transporter permease [Streptomyces gossypii]MCT2592932.1 ABC transporter permease [Streptomyces gossypii]
MTTVLTPAVAPRAASPYRVTPLRVLRAEWSKLWSLRSTWITLAVASTLVLAFGLLVAANYTPQSDADIDPVQLTLLGAPLAQVVLAVLGVLVTAGEYSTGMIRATMSAVPRRLPVLWAKAAVFGAIALGVLLVTVFLTFPLGQLFLSGTDMEASLGDPGVLRALLGSAVAPALIGVFSLTLGSLLRSVPGGIVTYVGGVTILPEVVRMLPFAVMDDIVQFLPVQAGEALSAVSPDAQLLSPGAALITLCAWVVAGLGAAGLTLIRRDV